VETVGEAHFILGVAKRENPFNAPCEKKAGRENPKGKR
jgi:hypothetical protein